MAATPHEDRQEKPSGPPSLRLRPDLKLKSQFFDGRLCWVVKDPLSLRYFKFSRQEYAVLQLLDGSTSLDEIQSRCEREFSPQRITILKLQTFLANLYHSGLLISSDSGHGEILWRRAQRNDRRQWLSMLQNPLAVRFRGVDPDAFLNWLYPRCRPLFSVWFVLSCLTLTICALSLVIVHWSELHDRLPSVNAFISSRNLIWLAVALVVAKIFHEFGHALMCKHFGGECHEMGVMLLVFTPCLYCDVSDSWTLSSRWHRMAIAAAGISVDLVLAAVCTLVWIYSRPGLLNSICMNIMGVCAVGTLLLNGNPLLRYDGYFVLSDLLDVPNLWQESRTCVRQKLGDWLFGIKPNSSTPSRRQWQLFCYGVASMCYRVTVLLAITFLLFRVLTPLGLRVLAQLMSVSIVFGLCASSAMAVKKFAREYELRRHMQPVRTAVSLLLMAGVLVGAAAVPIPTTVRAPAVFDPKDARRVYVSYSGRLVRSVAVGHSVQRGQTLASLENLALARYIQKLTGQVDRQRLRVNHLRDLQFHVAQAGTQIPPAEELLSDLKKRLLEQNRRLDALDVKAPCNGTVLPPPPRRWPVDDLRHLSRWSGYPMDLRNRGCLVERGTLLCYVGDPRRFEAIVIVDQADIRRVRPGQHVRFQTNLGSVAVLHGTVEQVARRNVDILRRELTAGREIASRRDSAGIARPLEASYQVRVALETNDEQFVPLVAGVRGRARIDVANETILARLKRFLQRTFTLAS